MANKLKVVEKPTLVFHLEERHEVYCHMCQQLGEPEFGVKMHRGAPSDTRWVKAVMNDDKPKFVVLCGDCIYEAHHSEQVTEVLEEGEPWVPSKGGMMFIRNTNIED
jgi:hypothetical protein|tara:strand:+ start:224 stop:544 length:321 start_codon:yes stop_codon:yes gene_type:complete